MRRRVLLPEHLDQNPVEGAYRGQILASSIFAKRSFDPDELFLAKLSLFIPKIEFHSNFNIPLLLGLNACWQLGPIFILDLPSLLFHAQRPF
jgi:hypothetical protein